MGDIVELHVEKMIPELELMERIKLFTRVEINIIKEKRKQYEYRLQRVSKSKDDIMKYIQYEMDLIKVIRQKTADKGMHQKKHNFEFTIINHVTKLYDLAIRRFSSDLRIWLSYIKFCKQVRFFSCASRLLEQLLQLHGAEMPSLYKLAANWEWKESHSIDRSRKYIHQGLRLHKDSKLIYTEAFRLELQFANVKRLEAAAKGLLEEGKEATDPMLRGQLAEVIYDSAITKIRDVTFLVELLNIADEHNFTAALRDKILEGMKTNFPNEEVTWDALARRELDLGGILKERIEKCIATYRESVVKIPTPKMWGLYLDYVLQLTDDIIALPNFKKNCLRNAFEAGHNAQMLSEKNYLTWIRKVEDTEIEKVAEWGTERYPDSIKLWAWRLRYHLSKAEEPAALKIFKEAISKPNLPDQITIWSLMLKYYQITDPTKAETLWREGSGNMQVGKTLKGKYIEWLAVTRGIGAARKEYYFLAELPPLSLDIHVAMFKLEDSQPRLSLKYSRAVYEIAIRQFGEKSTDVWMWYVKFEEKFGEPLKVPVIYERALQTLDPSIVGIFVSEYNLNKADPQDRYQLPERIDGPSCSSTGP